MVLAAMLRAARTEAGLTLRELARRVDVDAAHLSRVEQGRTKPSKTLLSTLASALKIQEERVLTLGGYLPDAWQRQAEDDEPLPARRPGLATGDGHEPAARVAERPPGPGVGAYAGWGGSLSDPLEPLFPPGYLLSPEINEVYELKLAILEARLLTPGELVQRGAYFVGIAGQPTNHFRICTGGAVQLPEDSGARLRSFLGTHRLKSSYATHGLFPYRGKFHPQMVKALLNLMGLRPGEVVLDPMAGSGTTAVEAALMGIDSVSVDASPFCAFLAATKVKALQADLSALRGILEGAGALDRVYRALGSEPGIRRVRDASYAPKGMSREAFDLLALAFLDARGYGERSSRKTVDAFFRDVLRKYLDTVERFQRAWSDIGGGFGKADVRHGDARSLDLADGTVDGVLFSPPYSFAIDYLANDATHLRYLGHDLEALRPAMIGLNAKKRAEQVERYFQDMHLVLQEAARVLKPRRCCTLVVGSNSEQLGRALGLDPGHPDARYGLESRLITAAEEAGLHLELTIRRLIVGMANTMREEHILILRKGV